MPKRGARSPPPRSLSRTLIRTRTRALTLIGARPPGLEEEAFLEEYIGPVTEAPVGPPGSGRWTQGRSRSRSRARTERPSSPWATDGEEDTSADTEALRGSSGYTSAGDAAVLSNRSAKLARRLFAGLDMYNQQFLWCEELETLVPAATEMDLFRLGEEPDRVTLREWMETLRDMQAAHGKPWLRQWMQELRGTIEQVLGGALPGGNGVADGTQAHHAALHHQPPSRSGALREDEAFSPHWMP